MTTASWRPYSSPERNEGVPAIPDADVDLAREIRDLREEVRQMRELVDTLLVLVIEGEDMDDDADLLLTAGAEVPRYNN